MEYDGERTYPASEWAARRWDWFNGGRIVEPLSFCQFWRTVVFYATVKWLLIAATLPVRPAFGYVVAAGERIDTFGKQHGKGMGRLGKGLLILIAAIYASFILAALFTASWLWTLVGCGVGVTVGLAAYGCIKAGVLGLLWQAAVAAKHGICPPVRIVRDGKGS